MTLRDLDIDVDVDVDASDLSRANEQADELIETLRELDNLITIQIDLNVGNALEELRELQLLANELDGKRIHISADIENITNDIAGIRAQLEAIEHHSINIDVDTTGAHAQIAALQAHTQFAGSSNMPTGGNIPTGGGLGSIVPSLIGSFNPLGLIKLLTTLAALMVLLPVLASLLQVLVGVLGVLGVAIGVVAGGLLAFVSAIGIAAIGLGGFAALGISSITALYDENTVLTKAKKELKKQTDSVVKSWKDLAKTLQPFTFSAITSGVASVNTLLDRAEPILKNATSAVDGLFASFNKSLDSSAMQSFFSYLERSIGPITSNIGNGLGYALQGVLNTMTALEPLTNWVAQGFENMMGRFAGWTEGLSESKRMQAFMQYVQDNLPTIGDIFGDMRDGIVDFFAAFDDTAVDGLGWMAEKMQDFATWASNLDENEGFQEFLARIKEDGPIVAEILGNIAEDVVSLISALADSGFLEFIAKLTDPENFNFDNMAENMSFSLKPGGLRMFGNFNWSEIFDKFNPFGDINMDSSWIKEKVESLDWAKYISPLTWPAAIGGFLWDNFISKFNWPSLESFSWSSFVEKFNWLKLPDFSWSNFVSKFDWLKLPDFSWSNFISKFDWIKLPSFSWSSFIDKFKWPKLPDFKWPEISMPSMPSMPKISMPKFNMPKIGFSSGIGRVPNDMAATIHKDEAIIPAHQAETLREMGVIEGDGRYPTLNTSPLVSTTTVSTNNNGGGARVEVGGVNIIVQGGNTNSETGLAVREAMEEFFAELNIMMPVTREW